MAQKIYSATGRRKTSVARVNLRQGKGGLTINNRTLEEYFGRETARMVVLQPFQLTQTGGSFDTDINVSGGGISGQAGAIRRHHPRAHARERRLSRSAQEGGLRHSRPARGRAQEIRAPQSA
jgi:small subunit ribosomal protein S9